MAGQARTPEDLAIFSGAASACLDVALQVVPSSQLFDRHN
jgi:organic hydroperoxide reductase OsmC/OhrA